jgi:CheY-like chemotaxis protein
VVDDHRDTADALVRLLRRAGLEAVHQPGGRELFDYLEQQQRASLIVLDLMMPGINGMDCLRRIRDSPEWSEIPVIVYSADFNFDHLREAERLGAQEFVVKGTMKWEDLISIVRKHLPAN